MQHLYLGLNSYFKEFSLIEFSSETQRQGFIEYPNPLFRTYILQLKILKNFPV